MAFEKTLYGNIGHLRNNRSISLAINHFRWVFYLCKFALSTVGRGRATNLGSLSGVETCPVCGTKPIVGIKYTPEWYKIHHLGSQHLLGVYTEQIVESFIFLWAANRHFVTNSSLLPFSFIWCTLCMPIQLMEQWIKWPYLNVVHSNCNASQWYTYI